MMAKLLILGVALLVILTVALIPMALWMLWRDGYVKGWHAARNHPPECPRCGYNLSGLTACRCPECGAEYRLDELWKSRPRDVSPPQKEKKQWPHGCLRIGWHGLAKQGRGPFDDRTT